MNSKPADEKQAAYSTQRSIGETGEHLGTPLFLQRQAITALQSNLIRRQPLEEAEEPLHVKSAEWFAQRQQLEEEELIQPQLTVGAPDDEYEREADRVADQIVSTPQYRTGPRVDDIRSRDHEATHVVRQQGDLIKGNSPSNVIRRQTAQELIDEYTNWGGLNLQEEELGARLAGLARAGRYSLVIEVINTLFWTNRDDVARAMMANLSTPELIRIARNENGTAMIRRMSEVLTDRWGSVSELEQQHDNLITAIISAGSERDAYNREIITGLQEQAGSDLEALALLFESDEIVDDGTVNGRLTAVLGATEHWIIPGLQTGIDFEDEGFAPEFRDPHPSSRNQVGHFLTAVGLEFSPEVVSRPIPIFGRIRDMVGAPASMDDQEVALRLTIGHEKAPDPNGRVAALMIALRGLAESSAGGGDFRRIGRGVADETRRQINNIIGAFRRQFHATTDADIEAWNAALEALGREDRLDRNAMEGPLNRIVVDPALRGNSREDLRLSLIGWRLGQKFSNNEFSSRNQVASWIRQNLGPTGP